MKTNSIKKVLSCVFGFLLAFTAVGCGGNSGDSSDSVELTIGVVNQPSEVKIINSFIKAYKEWNCRKHLSLHQELNKFSELITSLS